MSRLNRHHLRRAAAPWALPLVVFVACSAPKQSTHEPAPTSVVVIDPAPAATSSPVSVPSWQAAPRSIYGEVTFVGEALLPMEVPRARKASADCKDKSRKHNAIVAKPGPKGCTEATLESPCVRPMADVLVRLPLGTAHPADSPSNMATATVRRRGCMSEPRMLAVSVGQLVTILNEDPTLHASRVDILPGGERLSHWAQPKGADPIKTEFESVGMHRIHCDVHPWEYTFVWVSDHPYVAVTDADGRFEIPNVPDGDYKLEAWHTTFGLQVVDVTVAGGKAARGDVHYDGSEEEPVENKGELDDMF